MRLIDADYVGKHMPYEETNAMLIVNNAPTIEAEPVKHGHWERYGMDIVEHPYHCSYCGWSNYHIDRYVEEFKFCPNCGAKMWIV